MLQAYWYLLKVILCSAILLGYYWFMLRNKIYHHYNRFFLLAALVLSLSLPLLKINIWHQADEPKNQAIQLLQVVSNSDDFVAELSGTHNEQFFTMNQLLLAGYSIACFIGLILFIRVLWIIRTLIYKYRGQIVERFFFVNTDARGTPFSFLNYIFWNDAIDIDSQTGRQIFKHEVAHVQERHSLDKLFINIVLIFFWCNPFFWLLRKELNMIHEFIADKKAVEDSDTASFAAMILQAAYPRHRFELTNNFFYSPIKRRLLMLTKNQNPKVSYISRILVLPLTILVFAAFTLKAKTISTPPVPVTPAITANQQITVVLDAGHGGKDDGAYGKNGEREKDITLALVQKIKELNTFDNLNIVLSRTDDSYISPVDRVNFTKAQKADLFISIHIDAAASNGPHANRSGMSVYVSRPGSSNRTQSTVLASAMVNAFSQNYSLPVLGNPVQRQQGIWVLQSNDCPAVLIEAGHITNATDAAYLRSAEGQAAIASNVLTAINNYLAQKVNTLPVIKKDTVPQKPVAVNAVANDLDSIKQPTTVTVTGYPLANKVYEEKVVTVTGQPVKATAALQEVRVVEQPVRVTQPIVIKDGRAKSVVKEKPLYIVDNKERTSTDIDDLLTGDIISVNVLKDDEAVKKYGEKARNGVIVINTRNMQAATMNEVVATGKAGSQKTTAPVTVNGYAEKKVRTDMVFVKVEQEPAFPGGQEAWNKFLQRNLDAKVATNAGWKAGTYKVMIQFIVNEDGTIRDVTALNYEGTAVAQHCINLIKNGPKWNPAVQNGRAVNAYKRQPITFILNN